MFPANKTKVSENFINEAKLKAGDLEENLAESASVRFGLMTAPTIKNTNIIPTICIEIVEN